MQQWGFVSSWKQMTREPGWYKPIIILALVGWIPILGQIAVLGYSYEWARLTAWGLDTPPKRQGVNIGKVLGTGAWSFLVYLSMAIVAGVAVSIISLGSIELMLSASYNLGVDMFVHDGINYSSVGLVGAALGLLVTAFIQAAMMRATLYDGFAAGWRLDRLFEMIGRDVRGFLRTYLALIISAAISLALSVVTMIVLALVLTGSVLSVLPALSAGAQYGHALTGSVEGVIAGVLHGFFSSSPAWLLLILLVIIAFALVSQMIAIGLQMITINVTGQWFSHFDVNRWGVSSDPLPEDVPHGNHVNNTTWSATPQTPVAPVETVAPHDAPSGQNSDAAPKAEAPAAEETPDVSEAPATPVVPEDASSDHEGAGHEEPAAPDDPVERH